MMDFFNKDGHLTDAALHALTQDDPGETERLEISEHLSFCDVCVNRYTTLLSGEPLLQPETPLTLPVMRQLRRRAQTVFFNRFTRFGVAACLALLLWCFGIFNVTPETFHKEPLAGLSTLSQSFSEKVQSFGENVSGGLNQFFEFFTVKGDHTDGKK